MELKGKIINFLGDSITEDILIYFKTEYPNLKVVLKLGKKGSIYMDNNLKLQQSAFNVKAVDTTAAGDTFTGYFVAEVAKGTDYSDILKISSMASAISVTRNGAAPSIPQKCEVDNMLKNI